MIECVHIFIPCLITKVMISGRYSQAVGGVPGRGQALSGIGFLGGRPLVPVGAGVVMGWVGTLAVALASVDGRTEGDRKGPHATSLPLPPLRGRGAFSPKNLYLKRGLPPPWNTAHSLKSALIRASPCGCPVCAISLS